jgi:RND family efflux transporter MFP subunit
VWIQVDVFEKDLPHVRRGGRMSLTVQAYPGRVFSGTVVHVGTVLDEATRTVKIRSQAPNRDLALKPGMFADVRMAVGTQTRSLSVPEAALLREGSSSFVFVQEGAEYHRHVVRTGTRSGGLVQIIAGLSEGDLVVVEGQHQLKSRLSTAALDPHAGHVH